MSTSDVKFETILDYGWTVYWKQTKDFNKEQKIQYIKIQNPRQTVKCIGKNFESYYDEELKISKNKKIYIKKTYREQIYYKPNKVYCKTKGKFITLWDVQKNPMYLIKQDKLFKYYGVDWLFPYLRLVDLKKLKLSHIKKHNMTNIKDVCQFLYPNIPPNLILSKKDNRINYNYLWHINNLLNYASDKETINVQFEELIKKQDTDYSFKVLLQDVVKLCDILNEKFKISWSTKRLTQFHDDLVERFNLLKMSYLENRELVISPKHLKLAELQNSKIELITQSKRLLEEGINLSHCVGSYQSKIDAGLCAIYSILWNDERFTIEMNELNILQCRGANNKAPPNELMIFLAELISSHKDYKSMAE